MLNHTERVTTSAINNPAERGTAPTALSRSRRPTGAAAPTTWSWTVAVESRPAEPTPSGGHRAPPSSCGPPHRAAQRTGNRQKLDLLRSAGRPVRLPIPGSVRRQPGRPGWSSAPTDRREYHRNAPARTALSKVRRPDRPDFRATPRRRPWQHLDSTGRTRGAHRRRLPPLRRPGRVVSDAIRRHHLDLYVQVAVRPNRSALPTAVSGSRPFDPNHWLRDRSHDNEIDTGDLGALTVPLPRGLSFLMRSEHISRS